MSMQFNIMFTGHTNITNLNSEKNVVLLLALILKWIDLLSNIKVTILSGKILSFYWYFNFKLRYIYVKYCNS